MEYYPSIFSKVYIIFGTVCPRRLTLIRGNSAAESQRQSRGKSPAKSHSMLARKKVKICKAKSAGGQGNGHGD